MFGTRRYRFALFGAALLAAGLSVGPAAARSHWRDRQDQQEQEVAREGVRDGRLLPLSEVIARIRARYPGEMIGSAQLSEMSGIPVYQIMWLTREGHRLDITADARTGEILSVNG